MSLEPDRLITAYCCAYGTDIHPIVVEVSAYDGGIELWIERLADGADGIPTMVEQGIHRGRDFARLCVWVVDSEECYAVWSTADVVVAVRRTTNPGPGDDGGLWDFLEESLEDLLTSLPDRLAELR